MRLKGAILFFFLGYSSYGNYSPPFVCPGRAFLFFANGMNNTRRDARDNLKQMGQALKISPMHSKMSWNFEDKETLYNTDQSRLLELLEFSYQKKQEFRLEFWDWLWNLARAPKWFQKAFQRIILNKFESNVINSHDLSIQFETVKRVIDEGFLATTVSHSQGNFFANSIFRLLPEKEQTRFAISAVATPANRVEGNGPYVTLDSDGVIAYLANAASSPPPLPANSSNTSPKPGLFDHNFIEHYLNGVPTGKMLVENTLSQMKKLAEHHAENTKTEPSTECVTWFNDGKASHEKNFFDCFDRCPIEITGMADFFCPMQCDRLCGCESYGPKNSP